jgi:hypothetical protein
METGESLDSAEKERKTFFDRFLAIPALFVIMFVAPDYMGDVSLEGLDAYVLSAPVGSTREKVDSGIRRFQHCYYRKPGVTETDGAVDYVFRGTTSDVGMFVAVTVHCPFGADGRLSAQCTRREWALIPADIEAFERRTNSYVNQDSEWSNAGRPECPVLD